MNYTLYAHMYACACTHSCMRTHAHTHTHTNTQHRQPKSRSARLYSLLFVRLRCISDAGGRNGDTNDDDSDNQDPVLASALAYLSELKEKLNVYRLTGENLAGGSFHGVEGRCRCHNHNNNNKTKVLKWPMSTSEMINSILLQSKHRKEEEKKK